MRFEAFDMVNWLQSTEAYNWLQSTEAYQGINQIHYWFDVDGGIIR